MIYAHVNMFLAGCKVYSITENSQNELGVVPIEEFASNVVDLCYGLDDFKVRLGGPNHEYNLGIAESITEAEDLKFSNSKKITVEVE